MYTRGLCALLAAWYCVAFPKWADDGLLARFRNLSGKHVVTLWWIDPDIDPALPESISFFGSLKPNGGDTSFTSYGEFFWAYEGEEHTRRRKPFAIEGDKLLYIFSDETSNPQLLAAAVKEMKWLEDYYITHQKHWLSPFQRPPPELPFLQMLSFSSPLGYCTCDESPEECQTAGPLRLPIRRLHSRYPDLFIVSNFLSQEEAEHIINLADHMLSPSTTEIAGGADKLAEIRDSDSAWLAMNSSWVVEAVYARIGYMLGLDPALMTATAATEAAGGNIKGVASHLEVTRFQEDGHYLQHYDNAPGSDLLLNFITVQLVLRTVNLRGGDTSFPHALYSESDQRFYHVAVPSEALSAVFWYNLQADGNIDESSMYAHDAVASGELFVAHVNIWDPHLPSEGDPNTPHGKIYLRHDEL